MFDAETERAAVVWFRYTVNGRIVGRDYSDDPEDVRRARTQRDLAVAHSLSLDEFLALPGVR
ncbi:MAG: DUF6879 family protein [Pseudonocardiaceae bacterium]